ncbi:hypothetical protein N7492_001776 [Penicillium capsulatum]|uniref:Uncharacterized protein n=1 Tax=Penicillium capsulatum TaxID=69766 RepID=A0A9W9ISY9_9EURO|nr:hypothetical protein N7492_001776 [Penicillium capsulatum]KAJ6129174.1 hypothetical protein N7512_001954 [Penicillium capsulatum]
MKLLPTVITLAALPATIPAVDIRHFLTPQCTGNFAQCSDVPVHTCCMLATNQSFNSSQIIMLPSLGIAAICHRYGTSNCAIFSQLGEGNDFCMSLPNATGAYWVGNPDGDPYCSRNDNGRHGLSIVEIVRASGVPTDAVLADILAIDGHQFGIGEGTPLEVMRGLVRHFVADSRYQDIPKEYQVYELANPANDEE